MARFDVVYPDTERFIKVAFSAQVGMDFEAYTQAVLWQTQDEVHGNGVSISEDPTIRELSEMGDPGSPIPIYYTRRKARDTSLGGNDAINNLYGYCVNDDIQNGILKTDYGSSGMGRVYSKDIDDNQQILYVRFGTPEYNSLWQFFSDAVEPNVARMINRGGEFTPYDIGSFIGTLVGTIIKIPILPIALLNWVYKKVTNTKITKYYEFKQDMPMYYRYVNTILHGIAVSMQLYNDEASIEESGSARTGSVTSNTSTNALYAASNGGNLAGLPDIFKDSGLDIYRILLRKHYLRTGQNIGDPNIKSTDHALLDMISDSVSADAMIDHQVDTTTEEKFWTTRMWNSFTDTLVEGNMYVGFRIERCVDASDSVNNTTGESPVAAALNARSLEARNASHSTAQGNLGNNIVADTLESLMSGVVGIFQGAASAVGIGGLSHVVSGSGFIDVPDVWTGSQTSKSYNIEIPLRAPYGTPICIMQSLYVPLAMWIAGSFPRSVGANAYSSPFICQLYSKGLISSPLAIVEGINIRRGGDQHGWNYSRLPTSIDLSITFKDLSPCLHMGLAGSGFFSQLSGQTGSFNEYLLTLGGIGMYERFAIWPRIVRQGQRVLMDLNNTRLNPIKWGQDIANTRLGRIIHAITPGYGLPSN